MNYKDFAAQIKTKYPKYQNIDDKQLVENIIKLKPEYQEKIEFDTIPSTTITAPIDNNPQQLPTVTVPQNIDPNPLARTKQSIDTFDTTTVPGIRRMASPRPPIADVTTVKPFRIDQQVFAESDRPVPNITQVQPQRPTNLWQATKLGIEQDLNKTPELRKKYLEQHFVKVLSIPKTNKHIVLDNNGKWYMEDPTKTTLVEIPYELSENIFPLIVEPALWGAGAAVGSAKGAVLGAAGGPSGIAAGAYVGAMAGAGGGMATAKSLQQMIGASLGMYKYPMKTTEATEPIADAFRTGFIGQAVGEGLLYLGKAGSRVVPALLRSATTLKKETLDWVWKNGISKVITKDSMKSDAIKIASGKMTEGLNILVKDTHNEFNRGMKEILKKEPNLQVNIGEPFKKFVTNAKAARYLDETGRVRDFKIDPYEANILSKFFEKMGALNQKSTTHIMDAQAIKEDLWDYFLKIQKHDPKLAKIVSIFYGDITNQMIKAAPKLKTLNKNYATAEVLKDILETKWGVNSELAKINISETPVGPAVIHIKKMGTEDDVYRLLDSLMPQKNKFYNELKNAIVAREIYHDPNVITMVAKQITSELFRLGEGPIKIGQKYGPPMISGINKFATNLDKAMYPVTGRDFFETERTIGKVIKEFNSKIIEPKGKQITLGTKFLDVVKEKRKIMEEIGLLQETRRPDLKQIDFLADRLQKIQDYLDDLDDFRLGTRKLRFEEKPKDIEGLKNRLSNISESLNKIQGIPEMKSTNDALAYGQSIAGNKEMIQILKKEHMNATVEVYNAIKIKSPDMMNLVFKKQFLNEALQTAEGKRNPINGMLFKEHKQGQVAPFFSKLRSTIAEMPDNMPIGQFSNYLENKGISQAEREMFTKNIAFENMPKIDKKQLLEIIDAVKMPEPMITVLPKSTGLVNLTGYTQNEIYLAKDAIMSNPKLYGLNSNIEHYFIPNKIILKVLRSLVDLKPNIKPVYKQYLTKGLLIENYREVLINDKGKIQFESKHFKDVQLNKSLSENLIGHYRLSDIEIPDTNKPGSFVKVMKVEELQSDWQTYNIGKYKKGDLDIIHNNKLLTWEIKDKITNKVITGDFKNIPDAYDYIKINLNKKEHPLVEHWNEYALKSILRQAAKENYSGIALTKGEEQLSRWGTQEIIWQKVPNAESWKLSITNQKGGYLPGINLEQEANRLAAEGRFNQEAKSLITSEDQLKNKLATFDLSNETSDKIWKRMQSEEFGIAQPRREFMEGQYDKKYIQELRSMVKKWGGEIKEIPQDFFKILQGGTDKKFPNLYYVEITPEMKHDLLYKGQQIIGKGKYIETPMEWQGKVLQTKESADIITAKGDRKVLPPDIYKVIPTKEGKYIIQDGKKYTLPKTEYEKLKKHEYKPPTQRY